MFDPLAPPSLEVQLTVYGVAANVVNPAPAVLFVAGVNATDTDPFPAVTVGAVGVSGVPNGVADTGVAGPQAASSTALLARTWNQYAVPAVRLVTV